MLPFDIAGGSIVGEAHIAAGRNNQDAYAWTRTEHGIVAIVCDGCSGGSSSDVGAKIGARLLVAALGRELGDVGSVPEHLERARAEVLADLRTLARAMTGDAGYAQTVLDHFLFTVVGVMVLGARVTTFSLGDGVVVLNGEPHVLGPYPDNQPPYLGYALLDDDAAKRGFDIAPPTRTDEACSILIGTDGVIDVEPELAPFWEDERMFRNVDMVRRRLTLLRRARQRAATSDALAAARPRLVDDTTLVVLRRNAEAA